MFSNQSKYIVLIGFIAVILLMSTIIYIGYREISNNNHNMEVIVNEYNKKKAYISIMHAAARERSFSLLRMINMDDPFDRDEEYLHFNELATKFAVARIAMSELGFEGKEEKYYQEQYNLTRKAVPLLDYVIELLFNGEDVKAKKVLLKDAIPAQNQVLEQLSRMLEYQDNAAQQSLDITKRSFKNTISQVELLLQGAFLICLLICWIVMRFVSKAKNALFAQVTLESIDDAVITSDASGCVNYLNPMAEKMTGITINEAKGKAIIEVFEITEDTSACFIENTAYQKDDPITIVNKAHLYNKKGRPIAIDFSVAPILNTRKKRIGTVIAFRNVSKERELRRQLTYQACHDALTGLINRFEFEKRLTEIIEFAIDNGGDHAMLYLDLDEFKVINDTCGHVAGDDLLRQVSILIHSKLRSHDTVARLGGDEFGVILSDCSSENAVNLATKILHAIQNYRFSWEDKVFNLGVSIGVVKINRHSKNIAKVMGLADTACYSAKERGRNRIHFALEDDVDIAERHLEMQWVSKITKALENNSFELYFQPIVSLVNKNTRELNIEILVRMKNDSGDLILPGAFIPAAERYCLVSRIDQWVVSHVFEWLSNNQVESALRRCAINLSGQSIGDDDFLSFIKENILYFNIDPSKICFEITETAAIANLARATNFILELKKLGIHFALDDFGSGLSSFAYLKNLPVDSIKIDGMFIRNMANDPVNQEMVRSITSIAKAMGKKTIAEFVENGETKNILEDIGVDYIQGYYISEPRQLDDILKNDMVNHLKRVS